MKSKIATLALVCTMMIPLGCSLNTGPNNGDNQRPPEEVAQILQTRVTIVAWAAFQMDAVKPHKTAVCDFAEQLGTFLDAYDDKDASFVKLQAAVSQFISQIENPAVRNAVTIIAGMALTEAFNYTWTHYEDLINQDQTRMALLIAGAVADGLRDACRMTLSIMGVPDSSRSVFPVPEHD